MFDPVNVLVLMLYLCCTLGVLHAAIGVIRTIYARWGVDDMDATVASTTRMIVLDYGPPYNPWGGSRNFTRRVAKFALIALTFAILRGIFEGVAMHMGNPLMLWGQLDHNLVEFIHDEGALLAMIACATYLAIYRHPWARSTSERASTD